GLTCGPEKTGPPLAWSMIVSLAVRRPAAEAVSLFLPTFRPVTRPSNRWVGRILNSPVMLWPRRRTVTFEALRPLGTRMATSASPPEITSARSEGTSMRGPGFSFAAWAAAGRATASAAATTATTSSVGRLRIAPRPCIEEGRPARTGRAERTAISIPLRGRACAASYDRRSHDFDGSEHELGGCFDRGFLGRRWPAGRDQGPRPGQDLQGRHRGRPGDRPERPRRRDLRLPWPVRGGLADDLADGLHVAATE